jgi:hypothetical protein
MIANSSPRAGVGVQDKKKLDEVWPQNPWESVAIVFCYYLCTCRVVLTMIPWTTHVCPVGWWVLRVIIFLSMFWIKRNRPSLGYYIKRCFGSRTKPVYH